MTTLIKKIFPFGIWKTLAIEWVANLAVVIYFAVSPSENKSRG